MAAQRDATKFKSTGRKSGISMAIKIAEVELGCGCHKSMGYSYIIRPFACQVMDNEE
jgi:hypothetical protein